MNTTHAGGLYAELARLAPSVAFEAARTLDPLYQWDGDGPDPADDGFEPYDVDVTATAVVAGRKVAGTSSLGGSYHRPGEPLDDAHGYLPQMLLEAAEGLLDEYLDPSQTGTVRVHLDAALAFLKREMTARHEAQRAKSAKV
jgi:hypothetical protein